MATLLEDGRVKMSDGRIVTFAGELTALDICEIVRDCNPKFQTKPFTGMPAFISGGGGGGGGAGPVGPAGSRGLQGAQGPAGGGGGEDIFAATFVVNPTGENANFTTLEAALAAVPAEGAYIYLREGTYTPPAGGYIMPDVPVKVYGSGRGATIFNLGSAADRVFVLGVAQYSFGDFSILGDGTVGQLCFFNGSSSGFLTTTIERVAVGTNIFGANPVEGFYDGNTTTRQLSFTDLDIYNGTTATGFFLRRTAGGFRSDFARCKVRGTPSVEFLAFTNTATFVDCMLFPAFPAADASFITPGGCHVNVISSTIIMLNIATPVNLAIGGTGFFDASILQGGMSIISESAVVGCAIFGTITVTGSRSRIVGNRFTALTGTSITLTSASSVNTISNNTFDGSTLEIQSDGILSVVSGNSCSALLSGNLKIAEGVTADRNVYDGNIGLTTISTMREGSFRNNWKATLVGANTLLTEIYRTVLVATAGSPIVITLPPAATVRHQTYTIKKVDAGADVVTVTPNGAETIDGGPSVILAAQWESVRIISNGTAWFIEASHP